MHQSHRTTSPPRRHPVRQGFTSMKNARSRKSRSLQSFPRSLAGIDHDTSRGSSARWGFTLVELLVVIVIIGILAAFLVPAVMGAIRTARITEVRVEIANLEAGITAFKQKFGSEPPSSIVLAENGAWPNDSRAKLLRIWPNFDFAQAYDFNHDGDTNDSVNLDGAECLLFFLGGMTDHDHVAETWTPIGFSANPSRPFLTGGSNRVGPFFEFEIGRIRDTGGQHMPEYLDPLASQTKPYLYISSYDGRGYSISDLGASGMTSVYLQTAGGTPWKSKSYQIISPGYDGAYGSGGVFNPKTAETDLQSRKSEWDNITNFHGTELLP